MPMWKKAGKNIAWEGFNQTSLCCKQRKATEDTINRCQLRCLKSTLFAVHTLSRFQVTERLKRMEVCTSSLSAEVINRATAEQGTTTKRHHVLWLVFLMELTGEKMWPLAWDLPISLCAWKGTTIGTSYTMCAGCSALSARLLQPAFTCSSHFSLTLSTSPQNSIFPHPLCSTYSKQQQQQPPTLCVDRKCYLT